MVKKLPLRRSSDSPRFCLTQHFGRKWKERTKTPGQPVSRGADALIEEGEERDPPTEMRTIQTLAQTMAAHFWDCQMMCFMLYFSISAPKLYANCARFAIGSDSWHQRTVCGCPMRESTLCFDHATAGKVGVVVLRAIKLEMQFSWSLRTGENEILVKQTNKRQGFANQMLSAKEPKW